MNVNQVKGFNFNGLLKIVDDCEYIGDSKYKATSYKTVDTNEILMVNRYPKNDNFNYKSCIHLKTKDYTSRPLCIESLSSCEAVIQAWAAAKKSNTAIVETDKFEPKGWYV